MSPIGVRDISTARMSLTELARVWAGEVGIRAGRGGWLYDVQDKTVVHGWADLVIYLHARAVIVEGTGIDWRTAGLGKITPATVRQARELQMLAHPAGAR